MRFTHSDLDADTVRDLFVYDMASGDLIWRYPPFGKPSNRARLAGQSAGSVKNGYVVISLARKKYSAHRLVWLHVNGEWPAGEIDHIDGNKANNRICNLRVASRSENMRNVGAYRTSSTGIKGVCFHPQERKWRAQITLNRKTELVGRFDSIEAAQAAYEKAAKEKHGEFARTN